MKLFFPIIIGAVLLLGGLWIAPNVTSDANSTADIKGDKTDEPNPFFGAGVPLEPIKVSQSIQTNLSFQHKYLGVILIILLFLGHSIFSGFLYSSGVILAQSAIALFFVSLWWLAKRKNQTYKLQWYDWVNNTAYMLVFLTILQVSVSAAMRSI